MQTGDKTGIGLGILGIGVAAVTMTIPLLYPSASHRIWLYALAFGVFLILSSGVYLTYLHWDSVTGLLRSVRGHFRHPTRKDRYLSSTDEELGPAIMQMAWASAWGKWFSAQLLARQNDAINKEALDGQAMQTAASLVTTAATDGRLRVRGRKPNRVSYEVIPREAWRLIALHMRPDSVSLWRAVMIPRGGAALNDGKLETQPPSRVAHLLSYDSLVVDSFEFERLWPKKDRMTDRARRRLLRKAEHRGIVDRDIISALRS
jgi:hypothetical protein